MNSTSCCHQRLVSFVCIAGCAIHSAISLVAAAAPADDKAPPGAIESGASPLYLWSRGEGPPQIDLEKKIILQGKVLGPGEVPVTGAKLYICPRDWMDPVEIGVTSADGSYRLSVAEKVFHGYEDETLRKQLQPYLIAVAAGFGPDWALLSGVDYHGWEVMLPEYQQDLHLTVDYPIAGRIVDTSGNPVLGAVVGIGSIFEMSDPELQPMRAAIKADNPELVDPKKSHPNYWDSPLHFTAWRMLPEATTDAEGNFRLSGVGRERAISLYANGPAIGSIGFTVLTHDGVTDFTKKIRDKYPRPRKPDAHASEQVRVFDPAPTVEVMPARTVAGVVRDARSGEPLPKTRIFIGSSTNLGDNVYTDKNGRYRLVRCEDASTTWVHVYPDSEHLDVIRRLDNAQGIGEITADIDLSPGVLISGRVLEAGTDRPIVAGGVSTCHCPWPGVLRAGWVHYLPLATNAALRDTEPGMHFEAYPDRASNNDSMAKIDGDGNFRIAVPPGPGVLLVHAWPGEPEFAGAGTWKESDEMHLLHPYVELTIRAKNDGAPEVDPKSFPGFNRPIELDRKHAYQVINPPVDAKAQDVTIHVTRAPSRMLHFVGPDGAPMSALVVQGLTVGKSVAGMRVVLDDADAEAVNLEWGKSREIVAISLDGKHIARTFLDVADSQPKIMQLVEAASISGRVVHATTGAPLADYSISHIYNPAGFWREPVKTDADGRFTIGALIPGLDVSISIQEAQQPWMGFDPAPIHKPDEPRDVVLNAGETRNLGEFRIAPAVNPRPPAAPEK